MIIRSKDSILEAKKQFSKQFHGLKLEFYQREHTEHEGSPRDEQLPSSTPVSSINSDIIDTEIELDPQMSVKSLEDLFETKLGLHIQIFRRSNKIWLQTSATDDWPLDKQNTKGLHSVQNLNT